MTMAIAVNADPKNQLNLNLNPEHPTWITTETSDEYFAVCDCEKAGEFKIEWVQRVPQHNGAWKFKVRWKGNGV